MGKQIDGFSVEKTLSQKGQIKYHVYRDNNRVGTISRLGPMFSNLLAWEWHGADMWNYSATEFVDSKCG